MFNAASRQVLLINCCALSLVKVIPSLALDSDLALKPISMLLIGVMNHQND